ncbi:MAG: hypothetical protein ACOX7F_09085 [Eubacteriales bacterium]|jgi:hypothetical protein
MEFFTIIGVLVVVVIGAMLLFYLGIPALGFTIVAVVLFYAFKGCVGAVSTTAVMTVPTAMSYFLLL